MISILILLIFIYCCYVGYRRGIVYEGLAAGGYIVGLILATLLYKPISNYLNLWVPYPSASDRSSFAFFDKTTGLTLDKSFYAAIAFSIVLVLVCCIWRLVMLGFNQLRYVTVDARLNTWGSIIIAFIVTQISVYLLLFILATIPNNSLQNMLGHSILASGILHFSPGISQIFIKLFITTI